MNGGDLPTATRHAIGPDGARERPDNGRRDATSTRDVYAVFKRYELRRKHKEFSMVATMAREGKLCTRR